MDCFRVFAWLSLVMIPVVILIHRFKVGGQPYPFGQGHTFARACRVMNWKHGQRSKAD